MYCYANIGTPKNFGNPYYTMYDNLPAAARPIPTGVTPSGATTSITAWVTTPTRRPTGPVLQHDPGRHPQFRGLFKTPSNRDVDLRPSPTFVKAYMHNGVHKSLQAVVHFYNTRNIAVNAAGQQFAFDLRRPPVGLHAALAAARGPRQRPERHRLHPRPGGRQGNHRGDRRERPGGQSRV